MPAKGRSRTHWAVLAILFWSIFYQNLPWNLRGYNGGISAAATNIGGADVSGNTGDRILKVAMIMVGLFTILHLRQIARVVFRNLNPGMIAMFSWIVLSVVWSFDRTATVLRIISMSAVVLTCFSLVVVDWTRVSFQQLVLPPLLFVLLASLGTGALYPDQIVESGTDASQLNAWHGICHGKNEFGMYSSLAAIVLANAFMTIPRHRVWSFLGTCVAALCLYLSRSNTSQLATLVAVAVSALLTVVPMIRLGGRRAIVIGVTAIALIYEMAIQDVIPGVNTLLGPIAAMMGKDTTFSSRTVIWRVIKEHIQGAPWLGTGYGAYWIRDEASPSAVFLHMNFFYPTEAHNGYLEIVNDLGLVGLAILGAYLFFYVKQVLVLLPRHRGEAAVYFAVLVQQLIANFSESEWFSRSSTYTISLLAALCLARSVLELRREERALAMRVARMRRMHQARPQPQPQPQPQARPMWSHSP